jgi:hypothetical protein
VADALGEGTCEAESDGVFVIEGVRDAVVDSEGEPLSVPEGVCESVGVVLGVATPLRERVWVVVRVRVAVMDGVRRALEL